jgi:hypothetical protein
MRALALVLTVLGTGLLSSCKSEIKEGGMSTKVSASQPGSDSAEHVSRTLDALLLKDLKFKAIDCPKYLLPIVGLQKADVLRCFASMSEPEDLLPRISAVLAPTAQSEMGWRQDIGTWSSLYRMNGSARTFGLDLGAPGLSKLMRADPEVRRYRAVLKYFIAGTDQSR